MEIKAAHRGMSSQKLYIWAMILVFGGVIGGGLLQRGILGVGSVPGEVLLETIRTSGGMMAAATLALILQALETCAIPVFATMAAESMQQEDHRLTRYLPVLLIGLISEPLYDFAMTGSFFSSASMNPAFALLLAATMLYFFRMYENPGMQSTLVKAAVLLAAIVWGGVLHVRHSYAMIILSAVLWLVREKPLYRGFAGTAVGVLCSVFSPFYLASPMGFLLVHFYDGQYEPPRGKFIYASYPLILLIVGAASALL